jgi:iron complex outermembrane receptor protein
MIEHLLARGLTKALLATTALAAITAPAFSQVTAAPQAAAEGDAGSTIVVLGTRRADRSITDSASPVDVIGAEELKTQPAADMLEVLKNIVPSFNVPQNAISDASTFVRSPSIRGLAGDMSLVMINGKRLNRSALVQVAAGDPTNNLSQGADLAVLPTIAFGNLQILREGATAQYGTDAIAGVLNYTLREDEGFEFSTRYGQFYDGGGDGKARQIAGYAGFKLGDRGFISFAGEYNKDDGTIRNATRPSAVLFAQAHPELASQLPNYPKPVQIFGNSPSEGWKATVNASYDVTDATKIYAFGNFAHSKITQSFNYRPVETFAATDTAGVVRPQTRNSAFAHPIYLTPCPAGNATCPAGGFVKDSNTYSFSSLYPAGFTPQFVGVKDHAFGVAGIKGDLLENLTFDVSGSLSRNALTLSMFDSLSPSYGPDSQTSFEFGSLIQKETNLNADFVYSLDAGLSSPVTIAFGAEYRKETYTATEGDPQSYGIGPYYSQALYVQTAPGVFAPDSTVTMPVGASGYGGTSPDAAASYSQHNIAGYLSVEADLTDTFSVGVAGRYEDYNTFGSTTVGKVNALWKVTPEFSVRGTVGTGYHAPSPGQSNVQILTTAFTNGLQVQTGTYPVSNPIAQYYGATALKPEKSTNYGLGFVFTPMPSLTVTLDGYWIKIKDRIGTSQTYNVTAADIAAQPALLAVGEGGDVQYPTSAYDSRTAGIDFVGTYRSTLGDGKLNLTLAYNYNETKVTKFDPAIISASQKKDIEGTIPKHRATFTANYAIGDFTITGRENFYGPFGLEDAFPGQTFGSKFTTDIEVSYTIAEHYTLAVGATNLFNTYPDKIKATAANPIYVLTNSLSNGQVYPNSGGPFGANGGFWYARLKVKI